MPGALALAWQQLQRSTAAKKEIIVADRRPAPWLGRRRNAGGPGKPRQSMARRCRACPGRWVRRALVRIVKVGTDLPAAVPNYALAPLTGLHGVARPGPKIVFHSALRLDGFAEYSPPRSIKAMVDGVEIETLKLPDKVDLKNRADSAAFRARLQDGRGAPGFALSRCRSRARRAGGGQRAASDRRCRQGFADRADRRRQALVAGRAAASFWSGRFRSRRRRTPR